MITLAFGALMAVAIISLLIWFILSDRMVIYYGALFSMQALYIAYFSGQGFDWPVLSAALPLTSHAWNVPAAISGAAACMFVREIADLRRFRPRVHTAFGWFAVANVGRHFGLGGLVANIGPLPRAAEILAAVAPGPPRATNLTPLAGAPPARTTKA